MKKIILLCIFVFSLILQAFLAPGTGASELTLEAAYSTDVKNSGTKYYHDGNDWVGRSTSGILRAANRWDISGVDPSWDIVSVEVRFYVEAKTGSPGTISINRYGTSHGEDNPQTDTGVQVYSKIAGTPYASLPEPSSGSWTEWVNLGASAVSDITWCRDSGLLTWALGLKASDAIEANTAINHVDFSEDNEANDAELRITYTSTAPSNQSPTATITSITPSPATVGQTVTLTGSGVDPDGSISAYEWSSSINGVLSTSTSNTYSTSTLSAGTHTISLRVKDNNEAWSSTVTSNLTITDGSGYQLTLEAAYSTDVKNSGTKYYHDGNDWVGRSTSGILRAANRWDISGVDPSWDIVSVEVRFYVEAKTGSPGTISINRYGTSHGEDNPQTDTGVQVYSKIAGTPYASLPEPSSGSWTEWVNLGASAVSDITWCRDSGLLTWALGLKASDAIEANTAINHVDFSEDNEANDAELRITYTSTAPSNQSPTATNDSSATTQSTPVIINVVANDTDPDGTIDPATVTITGGAGYGTTVANTNGTATYTPNAGFTGTDSFTYTVKDNNGALSNEATVTVMVQPSTTNQSPTATITSITPSPATVGQTVTLTGSGVDPDGSISAYEWSSSINGVLSTSTSNTYSTSTLSAGTHTISLRVKDNNEAWSSTVTSNLTITDGSGYQLTLEAAYSTDVKNSGTKYYHDGNDWVGRSTSGILRAANRWDISGVDPSWDIVSVEVRFYVEAKTGSPGTISINRYGTSHGEDNPQTDTGVQVYSKIAGTPYASLPEPSSGSWTEWVNLGASAVSDITWCRDSGLLTWALGLKASDAIEANTAINHVDFSEDNEANDAELRITYTSTAPSNQSPTATITSITPSPATVGQTVTLTGSGVDPDGSISAYEWSSSINGVLSTSTSNTYSTSTLSAGTHTISLRVKDNNEAWSNPVTRSLTVNSSTSGTTENIYICIGYRIDWQYNAKGGLEYLLKAMGAQKDGDAWRYVNQTLKKEFIIRFVEDVASMRLALQEEGAHVLFQGHSNYGLGPVFASIEEVQNQYIDDIYWMDDPKIFNISSPWVSFSPKSMRTGHAFPDWWPEFQDGSSAIMPYNFNDSSVDPPYNYYLTYRIPGDPNLYKIEPVHDGAIERFPDSEKPAWYSPDGRSPDPTNPAELQYFLTNLAPEAPPVNVVGDWTWSREVSGFYRENYFYRPAGTGQNKVEWLFTIQEPGDYNIFGWWPAASHHTTGARYTVNHTAGGNTFVVDQTKGGGQWNQIGQGPFYFEPGNYSIVLSDEASAGRVVADGVKITALSGVLDKEIDNMVYPAPHYARKTVMFRKDLDVQKESLRYRQLFYDSCNSGIYYLDTFNRGTAFFTLNDSSCLGFNAYVKAYLEGKSKEEIWRIMQDLSAIYDYYDFDKVPSQQ